MAVKVQVTAAPASCPRPGGPGSCEPVDRQVPGQVPHPALDPVAGINWDTVRAPAADVGRRQARAARHLAGVPPGRRLMPAARSAKSPGTPPVDDDLERPPRTRARTAADSPRCPPDNSQREAPWPSGTAGHAARRPGERQGLPLARQHHGHRPGRGWPAPSPVPKTAYGKSADRAGTTGRFPRVIVGAVGLPGARSYRIEDVADPYNYALICMSPTLPAIVNRTLSFL